MASCARLIAQCGEVLLKESEHALICFFGRCRRRGVFLALSSMLRLFVETASHAQALQLFRAYRGVGVDSEEALVFALRACALRRL